MKVNLFLSLDLLSSQRDRYGFVFFASHGYIENETENVCHKIALSQTPLANAWEEGMRKKKIKIVIRNVVPSIYILQQRNHNPKFINILFIYRCPSDLGGLIV
jgi:hypothetical protein